MIIDHSILHYKIFEKPGEARLEGGKDNNV